MNKWTDDLSMNEIDEVALWSESVFIFETSALLNFYEYPLATQKAIFNRIFKHLEGRLWVPSQVKNEYLKNRKETLKKPESYYRNLLEITFRDMKNLFKEIRDKTKTNDRHPFVDQNIFTELKSSMKNFENTFKKITQEKIDEIHESADDDLILETFEKLFRVGNDYKYEELRKIAEEGVVRYQHEIPPGYLDVGKVGVKKYGDLIIWKQILDLATKLKKPVILINDDKKEDWWIRSGKEVVAPREELIREIKDRSGVNFWMYTSPEFLVKANRILNIKLDKETIKDVRGAMINTLKKPNWEEFLKRKDFIHVNGYQVAHCSYPTLRHVVSMLWNYRDYKLILSPISNPEIQLEPEKTFDLVNYSYLLLNPNIEPQRWLFRIWIKEGKIELELLFGPNTKIEIIDQQ